MIRLIVPTLLLMAGSAALSTDSGWQARQAANDQAGLARALSGLTPDPPIDCVNEWRLRDTPTARFGDTIVYQVSRREVYRTDTSGGCFGLRQGDAVVTETTNSQLCRGDIIRTVDLVSRMPTGSCVFGEFTRYHR